MVHVVRSFIHKIAGDFDTRTQALTLHPKPCKYTILEFDLAVVVVVASTAAAAAAAENALRLKPKQYVYIRI